MPESQLEIEVMEFKRNILTAELKKVTQPQRELFDKVCPKVTAHNIDTAIGLVRRAIVQNEKLGREP